MPEDLFLQLLLKHSVTRLRELGAEADEKIRQGEMERGYINKALEMKGDPEPKGWAPSHSAPAHAVTPKPGSTREPIKQIVASKPDHAWLPSVVRDELRRRYNMDIKTNTVRATMKRLLDEGEFARPHDGPNGFKLASANRSAGKPSAEATNSGSGGYERQSALAPNDGLE